MGAEQLSRFFTTVGQGLGTMYQVRAQREAEELETLRRENLERMRQEFQGEQRTQDRTQRALTASLTLAQQQRTEASAAQRHTETLAAAGGRHEATLSASAERNLRQDMDKLEKEATSRLATINKRVQTLMDDFRDESGLDPVRDASIQKEIQALQLQKQNVQSETVMRLAQMGDVRYEGLEKPDLLRAAGYSEDQIKRFQELSGGPGGEIASTPDDAGGATIGGPLSPAFAQNPELLAKLNKARAGKSMPPLSAPAEIAMGGEAPVDVAKSDAINPPGDVPGAPPVQAPVAPVSQTGDPTQAGGAVAIPESPLPPVDLSKQGRSIKSRDLIEEQRRRDAPKAATLAPFVKEIPGMVKDLFNKVNDPTRLWEAFLGEHGAQDPNAIMMRKLGTQEGGEQALRDRYMEERDSLPDVLRERLDQIFGVGSRVTGTAARAGYRP